VRRLKFRGPIIVHSLKTMKMELRRVNEAYYVDLGMMTMCSHDVQGEAEGINGVLGEYAELFKEANELPSPRKYDHAIVITEGSQIPKVKL